MFFMVLIRYRKVNNPYTGKNYNTNKITNKIYSLRMGDVQTLTVGDINWMNDEEFSKNWKNIPCILEVDLEYPTTTKTTTTIAKKFISPQIRHFSYFLVS